MSNDPHTSPAEVAPADRKTFLFNVIVVVAIFGIFALILFIAYLPQRTSLTISTTSDVTPEQRAATLAELRAKEKAASTTYGWVDQPKGVVRLPLDRAVELTIQEHNKK